MTWTRHCTWFGAGLAGPLALLLGLSGCARPAAPPKPPPVDIILPAPPAPNSVSARWQSSSAPRPLLVVAAHDRLLLSLCGTPEAALTQVAQLLAEHQASKLELLGNDTVNFELKAAGSPYVWPHVWLIVEPSPGMAEHGIRQWLQSFDDGGERRCGLGRATTASGQDVIAVMAVDALANLKPLPQTSRVGQWLELDAELLAPASAADVVLMGPLGSPRTLPSTLHQGRVQARFAPDRPGEWKLQVMATLESGPRPVLETLIFVAQAPPKHVRALPVPGEAESIEGLDPKESLLQMLNLARKSERLPALRYSKELEAAAQIQANAMAEAGQLAHDVGLGTPVDRIAAVGLKPRTAGENIARAQSVIRAHRALWSSPSHRSNLLDPRFTHGAVGVRIDEKGGLWVCQVFAELK